ncbi:hypothetical protein SteCoe_11127 [Stentor coeruleus]|uniref:Uncharacterized protein n=1 Tax=Stentor coeruleus TaxID=5963 RepID=A0A1R2CDX4_9CILI|nr:hypothetical protein SteCoe_11127 [Stentor coeruleus]
MKRNDLFPNQNMRLSELSSILERIKSRKTTVKHFFHRNESFLEKSNIKPYKLPPLNILSKKKSKSSNKLYTSMEIYLAAIPPKNSKTTVQQLMKMTSNAKALVSSENADYHRDQVINLVRTKKLGKILNC